MEVKPGIDRRKHEVDVREQVMRGVRTQAPGHPTHIVDLGVRGWAAGSVTSAIQIHVLDDDADQR